MAISKLLEANEVDLTPMILIDADFERNKLWAEDSGRLMSGKWVGTLIGIFPKIVVNLLPRNEDELSQLMGILDSAEQSLKYYNFETKSAVSLGTYTSDYKITLKTLAGFEIEPIKVSFISTGKE